MDKDHDQNNLNMKNSGGYQGPSGGMGSGNSGPDSTPNTPRFDRIIIFIVIGLVLTMLLNSLATRMLSSGSSMEISYTEFMDKVRDGAIAGVNIQDSEGRLVALPDDSDDTPRGVIYYIVGYNGQDPDLIQTLEDYDVDTSIAIPEEVSPIISMLVSWVLPLLIVWWLMSFMSRKLMGKMGGGLGGINKSNAKIYMQNGTGVTFKDVAGQDEAKESLMEIVDYLHNPQKYMEIGAKLPKGALLVGPPGTGKTLLAKAVAGEAGVPFFSISGSDFVEMFVGMGASRVRDLFKQASDKAPCIVFIDEIDAIGKSRDNQLGGNDEREQTLNQLLTQMDGFDESKAIVVLGATNRPEVLDKALRRPGRFDRTINVTQPDKQGRVDILKVHTKNVRLDDTVNLDEIALATSGASGADLANIVNEAALRAVRFGRRNISQEDLFESVEVIIAGQQRKNHIMSKEERQIVAYHEVGHALVAARQTNTQPIQKITIIPRTSGALGYTMQMPEEERFLMKKPEILQEIVTLVGGRAAEEVKFGTITTGASNDIEKATDLARKMVTMYGMSSEFGMMGLELPGSQYMDGRPVKTCSDETMSRADEIVRQTIENAYSQAIEILKNNQMELDRAATYLLERETITGQEFMDILETCQREKLAKQEEQALPDSHNREISVE
ncbi:cell division protease FtsH [Catenibacillus scindens]|uniref:ATP-dependent zinc metalloprotease FtsH n=1 Tax=Catenibacillus scindens TaxID=673271 RepID=A0A7W8HCT6_9FIRM|nr:ATP-dependent zinc metalloprotease FtsH [Catenibacillus scindens]MBB5265950.1 cell division protease FtsH [Catenibacillus scindens]